MEDERASKSAGDHLFTGTIPQLYEELLVPMLFAPYASDLARRACARNPTALLELAAGTGAVTRELAACLAPSASLVATDINPPMLEQAARAGAPRQVRWQPADAMALPFADASFDAVVCQFGVMFFPDRALAYAQARRVLRAGGAFVFNTWDRLDANELTDAVQDALDDLYPDDPPRFMARTPYGYFDAGVIRDDLARAGFRAPPTITVVPARCRAPSARVVARGFCQGTPIHGELQARGPEQLARATDAIEAAIARRFGAGPIEGALSALVIEAAA